MSTGDSRRFINRGGKPDIRDALIKRYCRPNEEWRPSDLSPVFRSIFKHAECIYAWPSATPANKRYKSSSVSGCSATTPNISDINYRFRLFPSFLPLGWRLRDFEPVRTGRVLNSKTSYRLERSLIQSSLRYIVRTKN